MRYGRKSLQYFEDRYNRRLDAIKVIAIVAILVLCYLLSSCKTVQPTVLTNQHSEKNDSIRTEYVHDSVYVDRWHKEYVKGDTIYIHDSIWRDRWKFQQIHDSIYIQQSDTIYKTVEVVKPQSAFLKNSGIALWVIIALLIVAVIVGIILKIKK